MITYLHILPRSSSHPDYLTRDSNERDFLILCGGAEGAESDSLEGALRIGFSEVVLKELWRIGEARPGMQVCFLDNKLA